jgi:hypothetical protein
MTDIGERIQLSAPRAVLDALMTVMVLRPGPRFDPDTVKIVPKE